MKPGKPRFFEAPQKLRQWFRSNSRRVPELWIGFHKRDSGLPSVTYPEALDEALCFGWIDGIRRNVNVTSYMIRFTPRRANSRWSAVNVKRARTLAKEGRLQAPGRAAFAAADQKASSYSYEQRTAATFAPEDEQEFRAKTKAWEYFQSQAPWYRRTATWWVVSAKKEDTRKRRLEQLIRDSAAGRTIPPLTRKPPVPKR